jgi:hypothetical protein
MTDGCDGDPVKRSLVAARVFLPPLIPLVFVGVIEEAPRS